MFRCILACFIYILLFLFSISPARPRYSKVKYSILLFSIIAEHLDTQNCVLSCVLSVFISFYITGCHFVIDENLLAKIFFLLISSVKRRAMREQPLFWHNQKSNEIFCHGHGSRYSNSEKAPTQCPRMREWC